MSSIFKLNLDDKTIEHLTQVVAIMKALKLDTLTTTSNEFDTPTTYTFDYKNKWLKIEYIGVDEQVNLEKGEVWFFEYRCIDHYQIKGRKLVYKKTEQLEEID